jgi:serine protease Do
LTATLIAGAVIGIGVTASVNRQSCTRAAEDAGVAAQAPTGHAITTTPGALPDFPTLIEQLHPSVVNISTESDDQSARRRGSGDPFEFFFGRPGPRRSLGSGFVFDTDGLIVTNHHVVEGATKVVVRLHNDKEFDAEVVGTDPKTDLAVIKITGADGLAPLTLGNSDELRVGEWVIAIGNPFGLDHTVTAGIVSAKGRRLNRPDQSPYDDFIQTDAAINPGNSGGPLVNLAGQVVGINTAIFSRSGGNIGIGFAIPVNIARNIVAQLKEFGRVTRGWLGVMIQPVDEDIAKSLNLESASGALVAKVLPDSPAAASGVEVGDVIIRFDGKDVAKSTDLPSLVADTPVGKEVPLLIIRDGKRKKVMVTVAKLEEELVDARPEEADELGLSVQELSPELARELGLDPDAKGVVVSAVVSGSPAEDAGIRQGDVIEMVGNESISSVAEFRRKLASREKDESVLVLVRRGDQTLFRVIKPSSASEEGR